MSSNRSKNRLYPIHYFLKAYPERIVFTVLALLISGLAEAISFAAMIPLFGMALLESNTFKEPGLLDRIISQAFEMLGLEVTIGGILLLVVFLMSLKAFLSFYAMKEVGYICADVEVDFRNKMVNSLLFANWGYYLNNQTGDFSTAISTQVQEAANVFRASCLVLAGLIQVGFFSAMSLTISIPITIGGV